MSSMPEVQAPTKETVADPAAVEPTTTASTANKDPIRPSGTDALVPESRPEVANTTEGTTTTSSEPTGESAPKGSTVVESQPINEGILNYKAPGLVKSLIFSKKFFWFGDEPLEHKHLSSYLSNEKAELAHPNAAHATQTGKGLLYYAKRAEDKPHPAGILNLGEISDFEKGGFIDFSFKIRGHKHTFQAPTRAERDGWLVAIETRSAAAKEAHEGLVGSEGYKSQLDKFAKSTGAGAATSTSRSASRPKKTTETKKSSEAKPLETKQTETKATEPTSTEAKTVEAAAGTTAGAAAVEHATRNGSSSDEAKPKSKSKSRSQSRKRTSIFGTLLGKKEEHDDKKEIKREAKEEKKDIKKEQKPEEKAVKQDLKEDKAERKAEKEEQKLEKKEAKQTGATSGPMDAAGIASRVVGAPLAKEGESIPATTSTTEPTAGVAGDTPVDSTTETAAATTTREAAPKANKRGSIFGNFFNKKEATSPTAAEATTTVPAKDNETALTSPAATQADDPVSSTTATATGTATEPAATTNESSTAAVSSPVSPDTTKPTRRTSFFNNLGTKKEKKSDVVSDAEGTDGEGKKSPASKLGGLFRKPSRPTHAASTKPEPTTSGTSATNEPVDAPALVSKEAPESATTTEPQSTPVQASA